ncbi:alpha/beta fold hydrolase [Roseateles saccharophilus]|uniref:Pimeloyl-ACP methyl ester carboxylesterase n=1 Tax=Roseateles saccharophilus TaxID=304 RepID=A0A4R3UF60_ROSSA|nr:alpha/beta hydrolase [Roseateles saccharophilus]MDG0834943.1 alpha/beta hydrolase [Roseateles saccharophilus]TCU88357.1 pimeloyl-ACP methyl ester carboxylesterase [Roseateles saccharophilus]
MRITHWIAVDGAELAVEFRPHDDGRVPLVFLHAGITDGRLWDGVMAAAAGRRSALRLDRRGFGQTRIAAATPHAMVADLLAVLDALALSRVELVGCSQGGRLAIDFALAQPGRVAGLTLVAPAVTGAPSPQLDARVQALADAIDAAEQAREIDEINRLEARLWLDGPAQPEGRVGGVARELFLAMNGIALRSPPAGELIDASPAWPRLEALPGPVRLVWGDLDLPHLVDRCRQMAACIPGVRCWTMQGVAHLPALEAPEAFNAVLREAGLLDG